MLAMFLPFGGKAEEFFSTVRTGLVSAILLYQTTVTLNEEYGTSGSRITHYNISSDMNNINKDICAEYQAKNILE